jgi:hypothetical protein
MGGRWREERLTVNYRTPAEIMALAASVLATVAPDERPPDSVRSEGVGPRAVRVPAATSSPGTTPVPVTNSGPATTPVPVTTSIPATTSSPGTTIATSATPSPFAACAAEVVRADLAEIGGPEGARLAVITPDARAAELAAAIGEAVPGDQPESLDSAAALLTVAQAKGLEFDRVVIADPAGIIAQSPNGGHDLYVAITRATHRLAVVYEGELPAPLRALETLGA